MTLLLPLLLTAITVRIGARGLVARGRRSFRPWDSWRAGAAAGMSAVYVCTGIAHFLEPQRSGLVAIVPEFIPQPGLMVTVSGLVEFALAAGLVIPRTRRIAGAASAVFLILVFPANMVAAAGVDHPAAPTSPLVPRALLQLVFLGFSAAPLLPARSLRNGPRA